MLCNKTIKIIESSAYKNCVVMPVKIQSIHNCTFNNCSFRSDLTSENIKSITSCKFNNCNFTIIDASEMWTYDLEFENCTFKTIISVFCMTFKNCKADKVRTKEKRLIGFSGNMVKMNRNTFVRVTI